MSLKDWENQYYPYSASECPQEFAVEHSLMLWRGLRPEASPAPGGILTVGKETIHRITALCVHYRKPGAVYAADCSGCPLARARRGYACDVARVSNDPELTEICPPLSEYGFSGNPEPMIRALEDAAELESLERIEEMEAAA